jgi:hypothetical protein
MSSHAVAGVVVFEADTGKKIAGRYFDESLRVHSAQAAIEQALIAKAGKSSAVLAAAGVGSVVGTVEKGKDGKTDQPTSSVQGSETNEIILVDQFIVLLRLAGNVLISVIARDTQNDLLMGEYLTTVHGCLSSICGGSVTRARCYDKLDQVFLVFDESVESPGGTILEYDVHSIVSRINMVNELDTPVAGSPVNSSAASAVMREGIAAISRGDTNSLRNVFAGAAQSFSSFLGR